MGNDKVLYHGTAAGVVTPTYGLGDDRHDYGKGFYLTEDVNLAKEWAACRPEQTVGYVHAYSLDVSGLKVIDFTSLGAMAWMAELMKHREPNSSNRFRRLTARFVEKFGVDTSGCDVLRGWRANASYFYIVRAFCRDEVDVEILDELLALGGLGVQYCLRSERAFAALKELPDSPETVDFDIFNAKYNERDRTARAGMMALMTSPRNRAEKVMSVILEEMT